MITVLQDNRKVYTINCPCCNSLLQYHITDIKLETKECNYLAHEVTRFIVCPLCDKRVITDQYVTPKYKLSRPGEP